MAVGSDTNVVAGLPDLRSHISYLVRSASLELTPREALDIEFYHQFLNPGTRIYVPHVPGTRVLDTVAAARAIATVGMVPVPHIAARRLQDKIDFGYLLDQLREVGCREVLIIGGGIAAPMGPFTSALDLLESGALEGVGFRRIGIAGHPEGSPDIPDHVLREAFFAKSRFGESRKFDMYVLTQFCFDSQSIISWEKRFRDLGNHLPVHVGLAGVTSGVKLLRYAAICGVKASTSFLRRGAPALGRLLMHWSPSRLLVDIASHTLRDSACMIRQIHLFPFGGFHRTVAWMKALGEGRFELEDRDDGPCIVVEEVDA